MVFPRIYQRFSDGIHNYVMYEQSILANLCQNHCSDTKYDILAFPTIFIAINKFITTFFILEVQNENKLKMFFSLED